MTNRQEQIARMELNKKNRIAAGLVSERFPDVSGMTIRMTYFQKMLNPVLMERIVNVAPTGHAYFNMVCMVKGCAGGGFDLSPVICGMVKGRKKAAKGNIVCKGRSADFPPGHASVSYDIQIEYNRKKDRQAAAAMPAPQAPQAPHAPIKAKGHPVAVTQKTRPAIVTGKPKPVLKVQPKPAPKTQPKPVLKAKPARKVSAAAKPARAEKRTAHA